jgi:RiboL-PSP-HEPN
VSDHDNLVARFRAVMTVEAEAIFQKRLAENQQRVAKLVELYIALRKHGDFSENLETEDILRASVVLLHATLEDFLRTIAANFLPEEADSETLNTIPLKGTRKSRNPEKFFLGALSQFKDETVRQVIKDSVNEYMEGRSFNRVEDVTDLLKALGLDVKIVRDEVPKLNDLMLRRHAIVHRADRSGSAMDGCPRAHQRY